MNPICARTRGAAAFPGPTLSPCGLSAGSRLDAAAKPQHDRTKNWQFSALPRLRVPLLLASLILTLAASSVAHASTAFSNWAALVVAGDDRAHNGAPSAIFDNARRGVVRDLEASGFDASNIAEFSVARHQGVGYARVPAISDTLSKIARRARGGCLLYFSSHGAPDAMVLGNRWLTPRQLARIVDDDCGNRPTVVVVSACFSGIFVPALAADDRVVITAARHDRTSFGCGQTDRYPYFDECVLSVWPHVNNFIALGRAARICVAAREKREGVGPPSEPQLRVGAVIAASLPKWVNVSGCVLHISPSGRDGAARDLPRPARASPRRPGRRECRRTGRGDPW